MIDLAPEHLTSVRRLLAAHVPECEVRAFGSRVAWTAKSYSDLDIALVGTAKLAPSRLHRLREAFEESDLPMRVDLLDWHAISESFRKVISEQFDVIQQPARVNPGRGEWQETTLGECAAWLSGGTPFKGNDAFWSGSIPWVSAKDMKSFRLHDAEDHISALAVGNGGKLVPAGTILLLVRGMTLHNDVPICMVTREMAFNQDIKALRPAKNVDGAFLAYWLLANKPDLLASVDHAGHGTGRLVTDTLKEKPVQLPPLPEQKAIAAVLGNLDDKIDLNRRMNATLEAMARALFQSWFVDFDPVRAKLDGRKPIGLDEVTADLFPATFQDSLLGHIPPGWTAQRLPDAIEVNPRRMLKGGTIAPYLDMKNLPTQGHSADEVIDREFSSGTKFQNGDTLLARITPCLENGKTGYVDFLEDGQVGWGSTEYIVLTPKPPLPPQFGYLLARSDALRAHAIQNMTGTSGRQRVPSECFNTFFLAVPTPAVARRFDELTAPLMAQIKANSNESRTLAALRDTLLPKLLSGEVILNEN